MKKLRYRSYKKNRRNASTGNSPLAIVPANVPSPLLLTYPKFILGDIFPLNGQKHVLRSIDFASSTATLERLQQWPLQFVTVPLEPHKRFFDFSLFKTVLQRQIEYVTPKVTKTGKFKLSKKLLVRLQTQMGALSAIAA